MKLLWMSIFIFFEVPHVALYYMHSSRMRTARSFTVSNRIRWRGALPLDADPLLDADPSPPWTEGMARACENITLPQTSSAGGKNFLL